MAKHSLALYLQDAVDARLSVDTWQSVKEGLGKVKASGDFAILEDEATGHFVQACLGDGDQWILEYQPGDVEEQVRCVNDAITRSMVESAFSGFFTETAWHAELLWETLDPTSLGDSSKPVQLPDEVLRSYLKRVRELSALPDPEAERALAVVLRDVAQYLDEEVQERRPYADWVAESRAELQELQSSLDDAEALWELDEQIRNVRRMREWFLPEEIQQARKALLMTAVETYERRLTEDYLRRVDEAFDANVPSRPSALRLLGQLRQAESFLTSRGHLDGLGKIERARERLVASRVMKMLREARVVAAGGNSKKAAKSPRPSTTSSLLTLDESHVRR